MTLWEQIRAYQPFNEQEEMDKDILLNWLESGTDILTRNNPVAHLTASAWVVSPDRRSVLMAYHKIYDSWAWLGGHADGDPDLQAVAAKEAREESGIANVRPLMEEPLSLEVLTVDGHEKKGKYVSSHLHLNVTYLFEGTMDQALSIKPDENSDVAWISVEDIPVRSTEPWYIERIYGKLCKKVWELGI